MGPDVFAGSPTIPGYMLIQAAVRREVPGGPLLGEHSCFVMLDCFTSEATGEGRSVWEGQSDVIRSPTCIEAAEGRII